MPDTVDAIEIINTSERDEFHLQIEMGAESFNLRIHAPDLDFVAAFEAANNTGRFVPESGVE